MNIDFTKIDKSDFECLQIKEETGAVYFGQIMYLHKETGELRKNLEGPSAMKTIESGGKSPGGAKASAHDSAPETSEMDEEEKAKYMKVRHGAGIQIYGKRDENGVTCKYAGEWVKDEKTGDGHSVFPDGSEYRGYAIKSVFNGEGIYKWKAVDGGERPTYLGKWRDGKMNG